MAEYGIPWTDERIELFKKLHADGLSFSRIAGQMGGITRNAAIGKAHRLDLPARANAVIRRKPYKVSDYLPSAPPRPVKAKVEKPSPSLAPSKVNTEPKARISVPALRPAKPVIVPSPIDATRVPSILDLRCDDGCKYPVESVGAVHTFCNQPRQVGSPYCSTHHRASYDGIPKPKANSHFRNGSPGSRKLERIE